ncbi:MAG TPA: hypothetical protein DEQ02_02425 [Ruminococcaceae bacterium]|nr:hypothetical protein [Oscillospiraceae bacterium]
MGDKMSFLERQKKNKAMSKAGVSESKAPPISGAASRELLDAAAEKPPKKSFFEKRERPPTPETDKKQKAPRPKKRQNITNINTERYIKPKKNIGKKILRTALWVILTFVFIRGIVSILRPDPISEVQRRADAFMQEQQETRNLEFEIESFAQNFAKEYLSYRSGEKQDYNDRVGPYVSSHVSFSEGQEFKNTAEASYVQAYKLEPYNENQFDVFVMATVDYTIPQTASAGTEITFRTQREHSYLKIPVRVLGAGAYIVEDFPAFVAAPDGYSVSAAQFVGSDVDQSVNQEIERVLQNFFVAYYGGNQTQIEYYLAQEADKAEFKGMDGRYKYIEISNLRSVVNPQNTSEILSLIEIAIEDINAQRHKQRFNILLRREGERYFILEMDTKTVGIKYDFSVQ